MPPASVNDSVVPASQTELMRIAHSGKEEALREAFYADCPDEDVERATSLRVPEALAPSQTPVKTTEENFGRVPRIYIQCLRDRSISPATMVIPMANATRPVNANPSSTV